MEQEPSKIRASHTPAAIRERLQNGPAPSYLRDFVYGAIDGAITTFAVVSGGAGAGLSSGIVIVLGCANLIADGFSMAVGNYLATRSEREVIDRARRIEEEHIDLYPAGEREEVRQIFESKGFSGAALADAVSIVTSDRQRWIDTMLQEEYGLTLTHRSPTRAAVVTFAAFLLVGAVPLLPFAIQFLNPPGPLNPYVMSAALTAASFFATGAIKARFVMRSWLWAGAETLLVGCAAAALAYIVGALLRGLAA
jgi:VIT1/CCC1 family predicted Fe2+/Mn2+ transporter